MIIREDLLKRLRSTFNLNIYEVKIWTALLSKGSATAGELSDMSDVPRSRSYDILESLEKKGFIIMKLGRPIKYLAVPPQEIIKRVKKSLQEKAEQEVKLLDDVQSTDVFQELSLLFKNGIESIDPSSVAGSFKGRENVYDHIINLMSNAEKEVIIVTTAEGLARKLEYMRSTLKKLKSNKINVKILASLKTEEAKRAAQELKQYADIIDLDLNARFVIVDNKQVVFMVSDKVHENADVGIWATTPFFASALKSMLEKAWK